MAITGPASYISTTREFSEHWKRVNGFLGAGNALILEGGTTQAAFEAQYDALMAARDTLEDAAVDRALARANLEIKKEWLLGQINSFKNKVVAVASASAFARVLPLVPSVQDGQEVFTRPMTQAAKLWKKLNATPPAGVAGPMVLKDGTTQAQFEQAVKELAGLYDEIVNAEQEVSLSIERRNDVQDVIYEMMKKYRVAVPSAVPDGNAFFDTLPQLTPSSTRPPSPVQLSGQWNAAAARAELTATASADPELASYELRACPGTEYDVDLEAVVAAVKKGQPPVFQTDRFLTQPGQAASFRVYVVLASGGQAGSNTVAVSRP